MAFETERSIKNSFSPETQLGFLRRYRRDEVKRVSRGRLREEATGWREKKREEVRPPSKDRAAAVSAAALGALEG